MNAHDVHYFKEKLERERERLLSEIKVLETPPDFNDEPGPDDEIDETEQAFDNTGSSRSYRGKLADVDAALARIEKGTYGVCEETGREIPREALEVDPATRFHPDVLKERRG